MGWQSAKLSHILEYKKGKKPKRLESEPFQDSLTYLDIRAIEKNVNEIFADPGSSTITGTDELVIVWDGARAGWVGLSRVGAVGSTLMALRPKIDKLFLYRFLQSQFDYLHSNHRGTGIPHVDPDILWNIDVPIPSLKEQERIVAKLNSLFEKIETNKKRLEKIPQILKRFRQSVLADAFNNNGLEEFTKNVCEEIQIGPFGTQLHRHDYISNGIPLVNPTHIQGGEIIPDVNLTISKIKYEELSNYHLKEGDVIMGRRGEMARCGLVGPTENGWLCGTGSLFFRPDLKKIVPQYLYWVLSNSQTKSFLEGEAKGSTMSNLNLEIVKNIPITLPSISAQLSIVKKVEDLFAFADKLESRYLKAKAQLDKLPQSILAKAFRGELVPQDPEDEPANLLLERILTAKRMKKIK